jgi:hypothetical protein
LPATTTKLQTAGIVQITGSAVHNLIALKSHMKKYCPTIYLIITASAFGAQDRSYSREKEGETRRQGDKEMG